MNIRTATINDIDVIAVLFDAYRVFYQQPSDIESAKSFLRQRIEKHESVIFLANSDTGEALGFTQLYPTLSSVSRSA